MDRDDDTEATPDIRTAYTYPSPIPWQVCVAITAETSGSAASRRPVEYPCTVTVPDGTTTLVIMAEMAAKVTKVIDEGIMMPTGATPDELTTYNYFNWQEARRLKQYRATLEERR